MQIQTKPIADSIMHSKRPPPKVKAKIYGKKYLVTSEGQIFTMGIKGGMNIHLQKVRLNNRGYLRANINKHDEYVHRIVAICFVPNPHGYDEVNHIDGIKTNNHASNLEWCTRSENNLHAFRIGLRTNNEMSRIAKFPRFSKRKFSSTQIEEIRTMISNGDTDRVIAQKFNCSRGPIWQIRKGRTYTEGNFPC